MKNILIIIALATIGFNINAQSSLEPDQNPNYQNSLDKYKENTSEYLSLQGTTKQQTYKAIDPMEEKRELKALRRKNRANRPLWRHQRNLRRIENTRYYRGNYNYNNYGNFGYNRYNRNGRNYGSRGLGYGSAFGLGILGCNLFD